LPQPQPLFRQRRQLGDKRGNLILYLHDQLLDLISFKFKSSTLRFLI
jgi:hypothetical protein